MNLARVDAAAGHHIATALTFLETLTRCPVVTWSPGQREAAMATVREARAVLQADLLTLAHAVHARPAADVRVALPALTDENAGQRIADMLMECAERLGNFPRAEVDARAWQNLLVYAPIAGVTPSLQLKHEDTAAYMVIHELGVVSTIYTGPAAYNLPPGRYPLVAHGVGGPDYQTKL